MIDTCIIIDLMQKREPFFRDAHEIFLSAADHQFDGCISAKSIADIHYLMYRFFHDNRKTREVLEKLFELFSIADTTGEDCRKAIHSSIGDYEDAVVAESALRVKEDCLVTRNTKDFGRAPLKVVEPGRFLAEIRSAGSPLHQEGRPD